MIAFWKRWQSKLEPLLASEAAFGVFLLFIVYLAYGLFLPKMGFYWDDWETIYLARSNSLPVYWNYYIFDRPQAIWTQMILVPFLGLNPLKWQLFSLAMRWLNALLMYKVLRSFWPRQTFLLRWAAILVIVYPGFQQQPLSAIYSRYFMLETLFFLSLGCMVLAYRLPRWRILAGLLSIFLGVLQAVTLEYFSSLELLRPVLLYILARQETMDRPKVLRKTLGAWLPYSLIPVAFLLYRYVFLPHILPEDPHPLIWLESIANSPVGGLIDFGLVILRNLVYVIFTTWTRQLQPLILIAQENSDLLIWVIGLVTGIITICFFYIFNRQKDPCAAPSESKGISWFGLFATLVGLVPILILGRQPLVGKWSDRYTLPLMVGCALAIVGLVNYFIANRNRQTVFLSFLAALALIGHIQTTRDYRNDWKDFTNYLWQVAWRAPAVEKGTVFVSPDLPFFSMAPYSLGFAVDLIYGSGTDPAHPDYWWEVAEKFDFTSELPGYTFLLRNITFDASFGKAVFLVEGGDGSCVHVLDKIYEGTALMVKEVVLTQNIMQYANTSRIIPEGPDITLPAEIFGTEPPHTWCYFFQKADLARQEKDWQAVIGIYEQAHQNGFWAENGAEILPLVEAYLQTGRWSLAADETIQASLKIHYYNNDGLCLAWNDFAKRAQDDSLAEEPGFLVQQERVKTELVCESE